MIEKTAGGSGGGEKQLSCGCLLKTEQTEFIS